MAPRSCPSTLLTLIARSALLLVLTCGACRPSVPMEPTVPDVVGIWDYEVTDFQFSGNECAIRDVVLTITEQDGERFSGTRSGGTMSCWVEGVATTARGGPDGRAALAGRREVEGCRFEGLVRSDRSVTFDLSAILHQGIVRGGSMTGRVDLEFVDHPVVSGTFTAVRR